MARARANIALKETPPSTLVLEHAFERFSEASARLEEKYELLRKEAEDLRAQLLVKEQRIKQTERLATLGKTAAAIAHEVRNPLGAIKLFVSLLSDELSDRPSCTTLLGHIDRSIDTLNGVVSNMLQFSRSEGIQKSPVNTTSLLREQIEFVSAAHGSKVSFLTEFTNRPYIAGDEHALRRVFYNLILNAVQATSAPVTISISSKLRSEGSLIIEIRDNGPGIPSAMTASIFEPFITGRRDGTGLGLAVVRHIIEQHGGTISARSDNGAVFTILLPTSGSLPNGDSRRSEDTLTSEVGAPILGALEVNYSTIFDQEAIS